MLWRVNRTQYEQRHRDKIIVTAIRSRHGEIEAQIVDQILKVNAKDSEACWGQTYSIGCSVTNLSNWLGIKLDVSMSGCC